MLPMLKSDRRSSDAPDARAARRAKACIAMVCTSWAAVSLSHVVTSMTNKGSRGLIGLATILSAVLHLVALSFVVRNAWQGHVWRPRSQRWAAIYWLTLLAYVTVVTSVHLMLGE